MDLFDKCNFDLLNKVRDLGIYPYFHCLESRQAPVVTMEGKRMIMLGSNNYLGFTEDPVVVEAGIKALEKYGTGCSGSRFLNGTLDLHLRVPGAHNLLNAAAAIAAKIPIAYFLMSVFLSCIQMKIASSHPAATTAANTRNLRWRLLTSSCSLVLPICGSPPPEDM